MAFDGFTIAALVSEMDAKLTGGHIQKIAQPEADELLLSIKNNLIPPERLKILLGKAVAYLLLLLNGQNGNSAFSSITAVFQKGFHSRPPTESGVLH